MAIIKIWKSHKPWLLGALCALTLTLAMVEKAAATAVEYAVMLALIIVVCVSAIPANPPEAWTVVGDQLQAAAQGAALADSQGNRPKEIGGLGKTIGVANAMMSLASQCDTCGPARADLQQIIGIATQLKSRLVGVSSACNPDGIIEGGEECDPLADPTGCPVLTVPSFCDEECQCEVTP